MFAVVYFCNKKENKKKQKYPKRKTNSLAKAIKKQNYKLRRIKP
jgi:hypothetical protein